MPHRSIRPPVAVVPEATRNKRWPETGPRRVALLAVAGLLAALLSLLLVFSPAAHDAARAAPACDKYAATSGSVQRLVDSLSSGQVGCLRGGTYAAGGDGVLKIREAGVTLTSAPGTRATLNARVYVPEQADRVTVSNLTIKGTPRKANVLVRGDYTRWLNNDVTNGHRPSSCFLVGSLDRVPSTGTVIENNRIHDCGRLPRTNHHHGIYASKARDTRIVDNLIYGNADRGVQLYPNAQGTLVAGNVISGNDKGVIVNERAADNVIRNNVSANRSANMNAPTTLDGKGNRFENNCVWMPGGGSGIDNARLYHSANNVTADPRYSGGFGLGALEVTNPRCAAKLPAGSPFRP
jgi:parallel beta-helix repeat protein